MDKYNIAVCDDDSIAVGIVSNAIKGIVEQYTKNYEIRCFSDTVSLEQDMNTIEYDMIMLDIDIPGGDGISFAKKLRENNTKTEIVFVSNREDLVFETFEVHPFAFIRKRRFFEDMSILAKSIFVKSGKSDQPQNIVFQYGTKTISVQVLKIRYIESNNYVQLLFVDGESEPIKIMNSLQKLEEDMRIYGFLRVHKGFMVNYRYIKEISPASVILTTDETIPISRRKMKEIKNEYMELVYASGAIIY